MLNWSLDWNAQTVLFFVFAVCIISGAVLMINFTKVVHMVVSLAFSFVGLAGVYILLEAEFIAFVQVLVYAGAISILMIFGIMMTKHDKQEEAVSRPWKEALAGIGCLALFGVLFFSIRGTAFPEATQTSLAQNNTLELGKQLFSEHVIPFELLSVLLTVAFIGAIVLAKQDKADMPAPATPHEETTSLTDDADAITAMLRQSVPADNAKLSNEDEASAIEQSQEPHLEAAHKEGGSK